MASLIPGYEYDIFISYRQKDNKGEKWVSEFVEALKTELESTFKEEISVYFDINPHDGLLETHDVDASLKGKLKCLVFIPVISRTYCDPKSFAWEHEFKAFVEQASHDQFRLKVKLPNGNVSSRVLPVRIHDLDAEDVKLCESVMGGVLRGVEFIYKEPGINKPLSPEDDEKKNINGTKYRLQINKIANAAKEIITGLKAAPIRSGSESIQLNNPFDEIKKAKKIEVQAKSPKSYKRKILLTVAFVALLIIASIFTYPKVFHSSRYGTVRGTPGKMSIVVNRFDNKTGNTLMDSWEDILPDLLRGYLATSKELSVQTSQTMYDVYESMKNFKNSNIGASQANAIATKLNADSYITGSFQKISDNTLIVVNLIDTKNNEVLMTKSVEGILDTEYKNMIDSLSNQIKNLLEIKALEKNANPEYGEAYTNSPEAYRKYIEGMKLIMNGNYPIAVKALEEAFRIDSSFTLAAFYLSFASCYIDRRLAEIWALKAFRNKEKLPEDYRMWLEFWRAWFNTLNTDDVLNYCNSIEESDTKSRFILFDIGCAYQYLNKYDESIKMFERVEKVSFERKENWKYRDFYHFFAKACNSAGYYDKEAKVLETGLKLFPNDIGLIKGKTRNAISKGDSEMATKLLNKFRYLSKQAGSSDSEIENSLGYLYEEANSLDKAEEHYRAALKLDPANYLMMDDLASFLIDHEKNIEEAEVLSRKVLDINPTDLTALHVKGMIYFKKGQYQEALKLLQVVKDNSIWVPSILQIDQQIRAAKKAVANRI